MKLEFNEFDINSFDKSEDWEANCVFILEDGSFIEGYIYCKEKEISYRLVDIANNEYISKIISPPKYYMFKD